MLLHPVDSITLMSFSLNTTAQELYITQRNGKNKSIVFNKYKQPLTADWTHIDIDESHTACVHTTYHSLPNQLPPAIQRNYTVPSCHIGTSSVQLQCDTKSSTLLQRRLSVSKTIYNIDKPNPYDYNQLVTV